MSSDRSEEDMVSYFNGMPWLALPFDDPRKQELKTKFGVTGIPKLVILNEAGDLITADGRGDVQSKGEAAFDAWTS